MYVATVLEVDINAMVKVLQLVVPVSRTDLLLNSRLGSGH